MEGNNILVKNLGKALNRKVKYVAVAKIYDNKSYAEIFFCLGIKRVFIIDKDLKKIKTSFSYDSIENLLIIDDKKEVGVLEIEFCKGYTIECAINNKIKFSSKFRGTLAKNIMCYYSIYHMNKNSEFRDIRCYKSKKGDKTLEIDNSMNNKNQEKLNLDFKICNLKNYQYF